MTLRDDQRGAEPQAGGARPSWFVVGAYKCGTTALHDALGRHPGLYVNPRIKESNHFAPDVPTSHRVADRGAYLDLFGAAGDRRAGEVCPAYLLSPTAPDLIAEFAPRAQIVAILRDPVARAFSDYMMGVRDARFERGGLCRLVADERAGRVPFGRGVLAQSRYREAVASYRARFGRDRVLVLRHNLLRDDPDRLFADLFGFLGVEPIPMRLEADLHNVSGMPRSAALQRVFTAARRNRRALKRLVPPTMQKFGMRVANRNLAPATMTEAERACLLGALADEVAHFERLPDSSAATPGRVAAAGAGA